MDIILIGSGNTATVLGRKSRAAGHRVLQVYSPQEKHAELLANRLQANTVSTISSIERNADLMIIAIRDEAIKPFIQTFGSTKSLIAHTAGALSIEELSQPGTCCSVLYPLQSLRREIEALPPLTILVDGNNPEAKDQIKYFASTIAETVIEADDNTRLKYHLAATLVNNFTNYLFTMAESFCEKESIDFALLQPLMEETVMRLRNISPLAAQTGPAIRKDLITLQKHRDLLNEYPAILIFYDLFTDEIQRNTLRVPR
jgi:predicted short-subunit dehydrogenase-like oxidoreductase (DUF2520 family)